MLKHTYILLPCQFRERLERRVIWREGKTVTCFACKMARRAELIKLKRRSSGAASAEIEARAAATREIV